MQMSIRSSSETPTFLKNQIIFRDKFKHISYSTQIRDVFQLNVDNDDSLYLFCLISTAVKQ